jgi:hypothetical protein
MYQIKLTPKDRTLHPRLFLDGAVMTEKFAAIVRRNLKAQKIYSKIEILPQHKNGNFKDLWKLVQKTGGGTFQINTGELNPRHGYGLSLPGYEFKTHVPQNWEDFRFTINRYLKTACTQNYIKPIQAIGDSPALYLGLWTHGGVMYCDLTEVVTNKTIAIKQGRKRKQIAIWDNKNQKEIKL